MPMDGFKLRIKKLIINALDLDDIKPGEIVDSEPLFGKYKSIFNILFNIVLAMYPILVFYFLIIQNVPIRIFSLCIIAFALFEFIVRILIKSKKKHGFKFGNSILFLLIGVLGFIINSNFILKLYPVFMNIILLYTFGITLFHQPTIIYRFAVLADKSIPNSHKENKISAYCYKVTVVWVVFFIINGSIAAFTVFSGSDLIWAVYNNGISYMLVGILFTVEFIVRQFVHKKISRSITDFKPK